ncbi:C-type lectin lectoxin-Lio2-like isoform X2 [Trichomycterus rosablanca]|uniref:C-type lectin lectoxin-Lio2-like isoform X2 n=1 Tax=Trichomycterus rosablanca TaxID=2290929 RepID=UPI002F34F2F4
MCYKEASIYVSSGKMSWEEALDYCQEGNRSRILQVQSKTQQGDVEAELRRGRVSEPVWVGLRQSVLFGFWLWTDGATAFPYTNWYRGEQPEHQNSHHCGAIDPQKDFQWCDRDCDSKFRVLCRV